MSFFADLKKRREVSQEPEVASQPEAPKSFFSSLKEKRESPERFQTSEEPQEGFRERVRRGIKDVSQQSAVGTTTGLLGSYGNIAQLFGVNPEAGYVAPGEKAQYGREFDILEKMKQPGYKPSASDIYALSEDEAMPRASRLPTSQDVSTLIEELGGPGEATTPEGKVFRRGSEIYGGGLSFGVGGAVPALVGGAAGESAEALGGGPITQAVAEIVGILATQGRSAASALTSRDPIIQARIQALRNTGYADKDIVLAINAQKAGSNRVKGAKATSASEKAFEETVAKSEGLFNDVLESAFPGYEKGTDYLHKAASDAYGQVASNGKNITITNANRFQRTVDNVVNQLRNTLGKNPNSETFITRIEDAASAAHSRPSAETFINFYKELNSMGKWVDPKNRERLISHVKNGIKSTFRNSGPEGKRLAEQFEEVNRGIQRAYQAEPVSDLIAKSSTAEGIDWKKMLKSFDKPKTWDILEEGLGKQQAKNLHQISKVAKDVGDFQKALGSRASKKLFENGSTTVSLMGLAWSLWSHNPKYATLAIGGKVASSAAKTAYKRLQTRLLTDPKFQNISLKMMKAVKNDHPRALLRSLQDFQKMAEEEELEFPE